MVFRLDAAGKGELWRDVEALACMMPEDRNAGVRSPGALAAAPFIPKTTYRRIKRCFSFRKGRSVLSLCSALLVKPWLLRSLRGLCVQGQMRAPKQKASNNADANIPRMIYLLLCSFVCSWLADTVSST